MRDAFISTLLKEAKNNSNIVLITGDLGFKVFDEFRETLPDQFLNAGIAEQNMIGVAAGLAFEGYIPVVYSIANFPSLRCLEQIRNDVCYHGLNVKIVSVGAGFSYGQLGASHHAIEDVSCLRAIPNLTILNPGTKFESAACVSAMLKSSDPTYFRIDRDGTEDPRENIPCSIGVSRMLREGQDISLLVTGGIVTEALAAADLLLEEGISCKVLSFPSIEPIDVTGIVRECCLSKLVVTVEEHTLSGGFGSLVGEVMADHNATKPGMLRIGINRVFSEIVGDQKYLRQHFGLDAPSIAEKIRSYFKHISS